MINNNLWDWLLEEDFAASATGTDTQTGIPLGTPTAQPNTGPMAPASAPEGDPNIANLPPTDNERNDSQQNLPDYTNDPQTPDMPEEDKKPKNFEQWKKDYIISSTKGNVAELKDKIMDIRDKNLSNYARKFVEDNLQILFLREYSNIDKASKEIRKLIKQELDHNNPATSIVGHMINVLNSVPLLNSIFIKLTGLRGMKAEIHRQFLAALTGSVQVGSGGKNEDLFLNEKEYGVKISTRLNSEFGLINLGNWELKENDPQRYLKDVELRRLEEGSPEERNVLRHRIIIDSISKYFKERSFIINVVGTDGTIYFLAWDISTSLKSAYTEGSLIVKLTTDDNVECFIDEDGTIVKIPNIKIVYVKDTGELSEDGEQKKEEYEFMEKRDGILFLTATLETIKEAATSFPGILFKTIPWQGAPSDLRILQRCVPSSLEIVARNC